MKLLKTSPTHFSYIRLLILFLCIPIIILFSLTYSILYKFFTAEIKAYEVQNQAFFTTSLEHTIQDCTPLISHLMTSQLFDPISVRESPIQVLELIDTLHSYIALNPQLSDIVIHFYEDDYFYSSTSSIHEEFFYTSYLPSYYTPEEFQYLIYNHHEPILIKSSSTKLSNYYYLLHPISLGGEVQGIIIFELQYDKAPQNITTQFYPHQYVQFIDTHHIKQSLAPYTYDELTLTEVNTLIEHLETFDTPNSHTFFELGNNYIYMYRNTLSNFILLNILPFSTAHHLLNLLTLTGAIVIIITVALSVLCGFYLFEFSKEPLLFLKKRNKELHTQVEATIPMQLNFHLTQLISGKVSNLDDFKEQCHTLGLSFNAPYYTAMILFSPYINFDHTSIDYQALEYIQSCKIIEYYPVEYTYPNFYIFIVGTDTPLSLPKVDLPQATFYLGNSYTNLLYISKSYIEASTLIDRTFLGIKQNIPRNQLSQLDDYISLISTNLSLNKLDHIYPTILKITSEIEAIQLPLPLSKAIFIEVITTFYDYFNNHPNLDITPHSILIEFYNCSSYESLKETFLNRCQELISMITENNLK